MPSRLKPNDVIPPEGLLRSAIDRPIKDVNFLFERAFGWHNAPIQTAARIALEQGGVSLGDIGCGSGNTLRTWAREVRHGICRADSVSATGVNLYDYSDQSGFPLTRAACADGTIRYIIADATDMPLEDGSLDVSLAYKAIEHCNNPAEWLLAMMRVTRPGGAVFFTADTHTQFRPNDPLPSLLRDMSFGQEPMVEHARIGTTAGNVVYSTLGRLVVPAMEPV